MASGTPDRAARWTWAGDRGALTCCGFRRLAAGDAVTSLGDGVGFVAVAWLAAELARPAQRPYAEAPADAACSLAGVLTGCWPGAAGRPGRRAPLIAVGAAPRMTLIGLIPLLWAVGNAHPMGVRGAAGTNRLSVALPAGPAACRARLNHQGVTGEETFSPVAPAARTLPSWPG
jgi:hypothetical protein